MASALVSADGFDNKAIEYAAKAMELDPKLVEAHELLANLHWKTPNRTRPFKEADEAMKISPEALDAMAIHAAIEVLADRSPDAWLDKIRQVNPDLRRRVRAGRASSGAQPPLSRTASPITAKRSKRTRSSGRRTPSWAST